MNRVLVPAIAFAIGFIFGHAVADKRHADERDKGDYVHTRG